MLMEGVVKELTPKAKALAPEETPNQFIFSFVEGVAEITSVPVPHLDAPTPVGAEGDGFTPIDTEILEEMHVVIVSLV